MDKTQRTAIVMIGLAWPAMGLGFMALQFGDLPSGLSLFAEAIGLFLSGVLSGLMFTTVNRVFEGSAGSLLVKAGYVFFAPIAIMTALIAPGMVEEYGSPISFVLILPLMIVMYSGAAMAAGLGISACTAIVAKILAEILHHEPETATKKITIAG
jgi:hypothetical protein